jgi:hypothetical protein
LRLSDSQLAIVR